MSYRWTEWAQKLQSIAQNGLTYSQNDFDKDRYRQIQLIAAEIIAEHTNHQPEEILDYFSRDNGYATPKVDTRGFIIREDKVLLVNEKIDGLWTLPGGWADPWATPSENVEREVFEEAGYMVKAKKLLAVYDREKQGHLPKLPYRVYKMFFYCEITGGRPTPSMETTDVKFFPLTNLPQLSLSRVTAVQIRRMAELVSKPELPVDFD